MNALVPRTLLLMGLLIAGSATTAHADPPKNLPPAAKAMISRGVATLRKEMSKWKDTELTEGRAALAAYAMIKGGSKSDSEVARVVKATRKLTASGTYKPAGGEVVYSAGVHLMLLEAARVKPGDYRNDMKAIVDFLSKTQNGSGFWNYLGGDKLGDTSVTQYGILGLWAAARAGIDVPGKTWDGAAAWLASTQKPTGGFQYRPFSDTDSKELTISMTTAGVSTLLVARLYLYPNRSIGKKAKKKPKANLARIGKVDLTQSRQKKKSKTKKKQVAGNYKPRTPFATINGAASRGVGWMAPRFRYGDGPWSIYACYGVERMAALFNTEVIGRVRWYDAGIKFLASKESKGTWKDSCGVVPATALAVLFLSRSTGQLLNTLPAEYLDDGLLRGGQDLPEDLSIISEGNGGKIKKRKVNGTLDQLLVELQKTKDLDVGELEQEIVKKFVLGDRKQWLQPKRRKQLLEMAEHPKPEVRRVAIWALGRTGDINTVTLIMNALKDDPDLDVARTARNALCWLSRKPQGFGMPEDPTAGLDPKLSKEDRLKKIKEWRSDAVTRWQKWYFKVRPYNERDDLQEKKRSP